MALDVGTILSTFYQISTVSMQKQLLLSSHTNKYTTEVFDTVLEFPNKFYEKNW